MPASVRCAGGGWWEQQPIATASNQRIRYRESNDPCGWEGERIGRPTLIDGEIRWNVITIPDDPCPNCGGRVELIPTDGTS